MTKTRQLDAVNAEPVTVGRLNGAQKLMNNDLHTPPIEVRTIVKDRIDQHLKFFEIMERIRWQFTSAFGIGAALGLFLALVGESSLSKTIIGTVLVLGLSVAGIIVQIRIYALVVVIWKRILILQNYERGIVKQQAETNHSLVDALLLPRIGIFDSKRFQVVTVGMINCFIFSLVSGLSIVLVVHKLQGSAFSAVAAGVFITLILAGVSLRLSKRYVRAVEGEDSFLKDVD